MEYTFKHALTQDIAYTSLLKTTRRELHARIVDTIEALHREHLGEHLERLADHALRGGLREKTVDYSRRAGRKAAARSAPQDARRWFEQAIDVLGTLPESPSTLEQAFDIRLELRRVLGQLGELRGMKEPLREAEALAERLNDDRRRGQVCASMMIMHSHFGELDEALTSGARALAIAGTLGDLRLRILTTSNLERVHFFRGEYERTIELATGNLAARPADWIDDTLGTATPVDDCFWLIISLVQLGRFTDAAGYEAEALRLAEQTQLASLVALAHNGAARLHLFKGDWAKACSRSEHAITVLRTGKIIERLPTAIGSSAWAFAGLGEASAALNRVREGEQLLERQAARGRVAQGGRMPRGSASAKALR